MIIVIAILILIMAMFAGRYIASGDYMRGLAAAFLAVYFIVALVGKVSELCV